MPLESNDLPLHGSRRYEVLGQDPRAPGRVSIIIPCYNGERFVAQAIDCALTQTWRDVEVVVVDDGSGDGSPRIIGGYCGRIRVIRQENRGLPAARNSGIRASTGEFLCFLDADDFVSPDFAERMAQALIGSNAAVAYCGWQNISAVDRSNAPHIPPDFEVDGKLERFLRTATPWPVHAAMIRAAIVREAGGFDESLPTCEDYEFWLRTAVTRPIIRVEAVMAFYRHHGQQMSANRWRQARYSWLVKRRFVKRHPTLVGGFSRQSLREMINGGLYRRGFDAFWRRDLASAQRIFRLLLCIGYWSARDLKYFLPALLPSSLFRSLVDYTDRQARTKH